MRVNHFFIRCPCEGREPAVLRSDECDRVMLIVNKLRPGQMACAAQLGCFDNERASTFNGFGYDNVIHDRRVFPPDNFGAECQPTHSSP